MSPANLPADVHEIVKRAHAMANKLVSPNPVATRDLCDRMTPGEWFTLCNLLDVLADGLEAEA